MFVERDDKSKNRREGKGREERRVSQLELCYRLAKSVHRRKEMETFENLKE